MNPGAGFTRIGETFGRPLSEATRADRMPMTAHIAHVVAATERLGSLLTTTPTWIGEPTIQEAVQTLLAGVRALAAADTTPSDPKGPTMPHDKSGAELHVGDRVTVLCVVKQIHLTEDFCNVSLETVEPMFPGEHKSALTLNAKQTEKA